MGGKQNEIYERGRQSELELQRKSATARGPASIDLNSTGLVPGRTFFTTGEKPNDRHF